jgi:hypothetical protein
MRERGKRVESEKTERKREEVAGGGIERFHTPYTLNPIFERDERGTRGRRDRRERERN